MSRTLTPNPRLPSVKLFRPVNKLVRPLLGSPLHRMLSGRLLLLTYVGRKSGRRITIPIGYFDWEPDTVLALSSQPSWMPNLRGGRAVRLRVRGDEKSAVPTVVDDEAEVAALLGEFARRKGPRAAKGLMLGLPGDRQPTDEELAKPRR